MIARKLFSNGKSNEVSLINDPFKQDCIESVSLNMLKSMYTDQFICYAIIEFRNGNTCGRHEIRDCEDLADAFHKAKQFIESL
jgi:hypothetical protein